MGSNRGDIEATGCKQVLHRKPRVVQPAADHTVDTLALDNDVFRDI